MTRFSQLILASKSGDVKTIERLIEGGVDLSAFDSNGLQAIHIAALYGRHNVIEALLSTRIVNVDSRTNGTHLTPLHIAIFNRELFTVEYLIAKKANVTACDTNGKTTVDFAFDEFNKCRNETNRVCNSIKYLQGCSKLSKIYQQQANHFTVKCVFLSVAEYLIQSKLGNPIRHPVSNADNLLLQFTSERIYFLKLIDEIWGNRAPKTPNGLVKIACKQEHKQEFCADPSKDDQRETNANRNQKDGVTNVYHMINNQNNALLIVNQKLDEINSRFDKLENLFLSLQNQNKELKLLVNEKDEEILELKNDLVNSEGFKKKVIEKMQSLEMALLSVIIIDLVDFFFK